MFLEQFEIDIDDIDEDFIEKTVRELGNNNINELLEGCSYEDVVILNIVRLRGQKLDNIFNSVILMYNFEYEGGREFNKSDKVEFIGTISYI